MPAKPTEDDDLDDARVTIRLPRDLLKLFQSVAAARDESLSRAMRRMIRQYVAAGPQQTDLEDLLRQPAKATKPKATTKPAARKATKPRR